jgi:glucose-6-phosphate 1-dehydrogenase
MSNLQSTAIVILGASGDLAHTKLIPALEVLYAQGKLGDSPCIVGSGRTDYSSSSFRETFDLSPEFAQFLHYHSGIAGLKEFIASLGDFHRIVVFFSLPPKVYGPTAKSLYDHGFGDETRLIIEKPFGWDYTSARELDEKLHTYYREDQIFRIDHYLAKEAVQNILVFRYANILFEPVWNCRYIESIQINAIEDVGIKERGAYFDTSGIIRDMVQNHLMQLLALLTMEAPATLKSADIGAQKINVLKNIDIRRCLRGQYRGYREEKDIDSNSQTETYAELELTINNLRWSNTPVYIRCGKALHRKGTEIGIVFRTLPRFLFNLNGTIPSNKIIFKIQPSEGILLEMASKEPGNEVFGIEGGNMRIADTRMQFCYRDAFEGEIPEAYQKLLLDAITGNRTLFVTGKETELSWRKIGGFLDKGQLHFYEPGKLPDSLLGVEWIDFDKYGTIC